MCLACIAKTSREEILSLLSEFIDNKEIKIIVPEIIISEFARNKERIVADADKSLSTNISSLNLLL